MMVPGGTKRGKKEILTCSMKVMSTREGIAKPPRIACRTRGDGKQTMKDRQKSEHFWICNALSRGGDGDYVSSITGKKKGDGRNKKNNVCPILTKERRGTKKVGNWCKLAKLDGPW